MGCGAAPTRVSDSYLSRILENLVADGVQATMRDPRVQESKNPRRGVAKQSVEAKGGVVWVGRGVSGVSWVSMMSNLICR